MVFILEDYVKKLVRVKTTEQTGNAVNYIGRLARFDDKFIELNPGIGTELEFEMVDGKKRTYGYKKEIDKIKVYADYREKHKEPLHYLGPNRTGRIPINIDAIVSIEELVED